MSTTSHPQGDRADPVPQRSRGGTGGPDRARKRRRAARGRHAGRWRDRRCGDSVNATGQATSRPRATGFRPRPTRLRPRVSMLARTFRAGSETSGACGSGPARPARCSLASRAPATCSVIWPGSAFRDHATSTRIRSGSPLARCRSGANPVRRLRQGFWRVQASGPGAQTVTWPVEKWPVVGSGDERRRLARRLGRACSVGARVPWLHWVAIGLLRGGGLLARRRRSHLRRRAEAALRGRRRPTRRSPLIWRRRVTADRERSPWPSRTGTGRAQVGAYPNTNTT